MTDTGTRWVDPNPRDPRNPRTTAILVTSGAALTLVVVAVLVWVVLTSGRHDTGPAAEEAILVAANTPLEAPFTDSILVAPVAIADQVTAQMAQLLQQIPVRADRGIRLASGRQPDLYGTTGQTYPCDVTTLANYLDADPAAAHGWGLALGLTPQQIPFYLNTLTPVVLMGDTWVTAHLRNDAVAQDKQTVLQSGTAVLIDALGVPRVHCASGSPLTPPADGNLTTYRLTGEPWPDFAVQNALAIKYAAADSPGSVTEFTLVDVTTGQPVTRKAGGIIDLGSATAPLPDPAVMNIPTP